MTCRLHRDHHNIAIVLSPTSYTMSEEGDAAAAAAEAARAEAEARRRRILEKSKMRLGIVSGEQVAPSIVAPWSASGDKVEDATTADATGTSVTDEVATGGDVKKSSTTAARMHAMRKRRFKKSEVSEAQTATTTTSIPNVESDDIKKTDASTTTATDEPSPSNEDIKTSEVEPQPTPEDQVAPENVPTVTAEESATARSPLTIGTALEDKEPSKKYVGVAKMRRQMIKQKLQQDADAPDSTCPAATGGPTLAAPAIAKPSISREKYIRAVPIFMNIFTILLLFGAGLDVGLQQLHHSMLKENVLVRNDWGPLQGGILSLFFAKNVTTTKQIRRDFATESFAQQQDDVKKMQRRANQKEESSKASAEFNDPPKTKPAGVADDDDDDDVDEEFYNYVPHLDPIFRVDLDRMTQGPGIFLQLARGAIGIHRLMLALFFYLPQRVLRTFLQLPQCLWATPPVLCVVALVTRQLVAKMLLGGAVLPDTDQQDSTAAKTFDVLAMVQQYVTTFVTKSFPTLFGLYEVWTLLRQDLYIMLCGMFVGLAWIHSVGCRHGMFNTTLTTPGGEEL